MRTVALTDLHGRFTRDDQTTESIKNADLVLIAGDITNFGDADDAKTIIDEIKTLNPKILAVHGNCDEVSVNSLLQNQGINLHARSKVIGDTAFYGLGGSNKTPFHTPQECNDSELRSILQGFSRIQGVRFHILISHMPPQHTKLDRTIFGLNVGSVVLREFIEGFQPDLVICGHIHEARGIDQINKTLLINPGPFPEHFAIIDLDKEIGYELR